MRFVLLTSFLFAACTVGEVGTSENGTDPGSGSNGSNGSNGSGSGSGSADFAACMDRLGQPDAAHVHIAGGTSNKGLNCIVAGCHLNNNLGAGAPGYQFAGTVYKAGTTTPSAGAVVRIKSGTNILTAYTDADGNFHFQAGSLAGAFTANTNVAGCPTITSMGGALTGGNGGGAGANSCNLCHTAAAGGTTTPIQL
jgi:hypothetical protein